MATKHTFNFKNTDANKEVSEKMVNIASPSAAPAALTIAPTKGSARTISKDWTLVQTKVPHDLNLRITDYCLKNRISKNDFMLAAARKFMSELENPN